MIQNIGKLGLATILLTGTAVTIAPEAFAKTVLNWQKYDINKFTKKNTVVSEGYKSVPSTAYWHHSNTSKAGGGWNYNRYVIALTYYSSVTKKYY